MGIEDEIRAADTGELGVRFVDKNDVSKAASPRGESTLGTSELEIVNEFLKVKLIDEFILSIITIFVGSGTKHFKDGRPEQQLQLFSTKQFDKGLVQLHYKSVD